MSNVTINGERVEIPMAEMLSNEQIQSLAAHAAADGDLYTCAVCQIAIYAYPYFATWERLDTAAKSQLHREYLAPDARSWYPERAQFELLRRASGAA